MWQFIGIRVIQGFFTLLVISLLVFLATPPNRRPALVLLPAEASSKADYERVKKQTWPGQTLSHQYFIFLKGAVQGDFGLSIRDRRPTRDLLLERLPATLQLALAGMVLAIVIGVPLGILSAVRRDSIFDKGSKLFAVLGMAAPQFWVAIMLILLFGAILKVLPTYGREGPENFILPSFVLAWSIMAGIMRLGRSSMLEVLDSDYVRFARIKGLKDGMVVWKHALRNALIPILTFSGISLAGLLNGAIVVEQVFAWPGLGRLMLDGVLQRNFPVVQAAVMASAFFYILTALIVDILYVYADPRIRH